MTHYFDYAATSPLYGEVLDAMQPYLIPGLEGLGKTANPNSLHSPGRESFADMEAFRRRTMAALGAKRPDEITFTGSATESDNAAIYGLFQGALEQRRKSGRPASNPAIIVSSIEHEAVLQPAHLLKEQGFDVVSVSPDRYGFISPERVAEAAEGKDVLVVSIMAANSEIGSIQPVKELSDLSHSLGAVFHTDAVQALGKVPLNMQELGVDAATFSGHKIGAPKGVGVLYLKARTPFKPFLLGGGQESGRRSSTQNVAGMAAFTTAVEYAVSMVEKERLRLGSYRDELIDNLTEHPRIKVTVPAKGSDKFLPNIVHILVEGMESETLILRMDKLGYCVSGGSACSSHSLDSSHVLRSMGISDNEARGALRLSMGRYTDQTEIGPLCDALFSCIDR